MAGILSLLILVVLLGGLIFGIVLWITGGRSGSGSEMACGGCGYAVRGLEALNCPECGADLRMVGINRGTNGGSRVFGIVLTVCCGGLLMLGCLGSWLFMPGSNSSQSIQSVPVQAYPSQPSTTTNAPQAVGAEDTEEDTEQGDTADPPPVEAPGPEEPTP